MTEKRLIEIESCQRHTHAMVKDLHAHVVGQPGTDGLVTRVAKVESKQAFHSKLSWAGMVAILSVVVAFFKTKL
jgi:hypothetical protein